MRAKDFIPKDKPRNFVAKNAKMGGAGQHKDKKKAEKQGDVKHKKSLMPMEDTLSELSTEKLGQYKKAAAADAKKADAEGDYKRGDKRFKGINRATNKQFDNDLKKHGQDVEEGWDDVKKFGKKAAVAGAIGLGALGAHAQDVPSGEDFLPDIVAHVTFKVDGNTITKDINLGTAYKTPGKASEALEKFLKSKGIKYYEYSLERVKPKDDDYLDKTPYTTSGTDHGRIDTGPAVGNKTKSDYMYKD